MPISKQKSKKKNFIKTTKKFLSSWSAKKLLLTFIILFAAVAGVLLYRSFAATGDELQAKNNSTWAGAYAKRVVMSPDGSYGFTLDAFGGIHPFHTYGSQPGIPTGVAYFKDQDIARDIVVTHWDPTGATLRGYVLDGYGVLHPFGGATAVRGAAYWKGWDIARRVVLVKVANGTGGYVLDGFGGLHPFAIGSATMPPAVKQGPYWPGKDIARDVIIRSDNAVGMVLSCDGGISPVGFGTNSAPGYPNGYPYAKDTCKYQSFVDTEWTKPSGLVLSTGGEFSGFGTRGVKPYIASGLGRVVDGDSHVVNGVRRYWAMDERGNIRAFSEPNVPLFTDQEQAFFIALKKAQDAAAARQSSLPKPSASTAAAGCSKSLLEINSSDSPACIKVLQMAIGAKVDGIWGPETELKRQYWIDNFARNFMPGASNGSGTPNYHYLSDFKFVHVDTNSFTRSTMNYKFCVRAYARDGGQVTITHHVSDKWDAYGLSGFSSRQTETDTVYNGQSACITVGVAQGNYVDELDYYSVSDGRAGTGIYDTTYTGPF
ncbi:MAG: hypothetical protein ACXWLH_05075 [Candidatus Saccharimonadales bacterium]